MRITLSLDEDVARLVEEEQHRTRSSMKEIVNAALRAALAPKPTRAEPYRVKVHETELRPGYDLGSCPAVRCSRSGWSSPATSATER